MTEMLQRAIAEIEKLPEDEQDAIAARVLADLADEQGWNELGVTRLRRKGGCNGDEPGSPVWLHGSRQPWLDTN